MRVFDRHKARALREEGMSWRKIAAKLEVPVSTVVDACRTEIPLEHGPKVTQKRKNLEGQ
jgi:hypothetical protein